VTASRVRLTPEAAARFPDLATRTGSVTRSEPNGWVVVRWSGVVGQTTIPAGDLEGV
jgi:hypothetical protein